MNARREASRRIGLWAAVSIGVGGMIGAGIFSVLGIAAEEVGNAVPLSFVIAGLVALLSAYSYAKLGVTYPSAGGPVEFLVQGFGGGVLSGGLNILLWIGYLFALALYAKAFGGYFYTFLPEGAPAAWVNLSGTAVVLLFTAVNFIGAKAVGRSETVIVSVKVGILAVFALITLGFVRVDLLSPARWPEPSALLFGAGLVFIAYEGFGLVTNAAEDMPRPRETLPRALYLSVLITMAIYVAVSLAVVGNLPVAEIARARDYALAEAARPVLGVLGFKLMAVAALFSTSSAISATLYGGANVSYQIARDGQLPEVYERKVWGRASEGLFITAGLVILAVNALDLSGIALLGSSLFLVIYASVNAAHLRLLKNTGARPGMIWAAILGCLVSLGILLYYEWTTAPGTLGVLLAVIAAAFGLEGTYRAATRRRLHRRAPSQRPGGARERAERR